MANDNTLVDPVLENTVYDATIKPKQSPKSNIVTYLILGVTVLIIGIAMGWYLNSSNQQYAVQPAADLNTTQVPFFVGGIMPLTGDAAAYGIPLQQAAILAQREINETGGINGRELKILWRDGLCDSNTAKTMAEELVQKDIGLLIGGACSSEYLASAPVSQAQGIISFSPSATSHEISTLGSYVFRTAPSNAEVGRVAAEYSKNSLKAQTAAVLVENKEYPQSLSLIFTDVFTSQGGTIVYNKTFETGTTNFLDYVSEIGALNPDIIYLVPQTSIPGVLFVQALRNAGFQNPIMSAEALMSRDEVESNGTVLEGIYGVEAYLDENYGKTKEFLSLFEREYGVSASFPNFMAGMYDTLFIMRDAVEAVGGDVDAVSNYILDLSSWSGASGTIGFDDNGDPKLSYSILRITNNNLVQVEVYTPEQ